MGGLLLTLFDVKIYNKDKSAVDRTRRSDNVNIFIRCLQLVYVRTLEYTIVQY